MDWVVSQSFESEFNDLERERTSLERRVLCHVMLQKFCKDFQCSPFCVDGCTQHGCHMECCRAAFK
jgi:hypothetical protein